MVTERPMKRARGGRVSGSRVMVERRGEGKGKVWVRKGIAWVWGLMMGRGDAAYRV